MSSPCFSGRLPLPVAAYVNDRSGEGRQDLTAPCERSLPLTHSYSLPRRSWPLSRIISKPCMFAGITTMLPSLSANLSRAVLTSCCRYSAVRLELMILLASAIPLARSISASFFLRSRKPVDGWPRGLREIEGRRRAYIYRRHRVLPQRWRQRLLLQA